MWSSFEQLIRFVIYMLRILPKESYHTETRPTPNPTKIEILMFCVIQIESFSWAKHLIAKPTHQFLWNLAVL